MVIYRNIYIFRYFKKISKKKTYTFRFRSIHNFPPMPTAPGMRGLSGSRHHCSRSLWNGNLIFNFVAIGRRNIFSLFFFRQTDVTTTKLRQSMRRKWERSVSWCAENWKINRRELFLYILWKEKVILQVLLILKVLWWYTSRKFPKEKNRTYKL